MAFWNGTHWVPDEPTPQSRGRHRLWGAAAEAGLITLLIFGLIAGSALAAKGGQRGSDSSSLSLVLLDSTDGVPHYGQQVTFTVSTAATDKPYVNVRCYQAGAFVYDGWAGFFAGAWFGQTFTLASPSWTSGAADCTARLVMYSKNGRERTLGTLDFYVAP